MTTKQILKAIKLNPDKLVLSITLNEAVDRLLEFIKEWELQIQIKKISKKDWEILLNNYSDAITDYHPENDHQERGAFLRTEKILMKYGLTREDTARLDFC